MQFFVFGDVAAEPIDGSNSVLQRGISPPDSKAQRAHLVLLSILPLITEAEIVGTVAEYDDPASERPVDYREVYDTEGNLVALSWFDGFGIQRVAVDRGLVEESGEPEGVIVLLADGDSVWRARHHAMRKSLQASRRVTLVRRAPVAGHRAQTYGEEQSLNAVEFTIVTGLGSFIAGLLGSLTGLGGGVVIVPLLTLVFGVDIRYAIGASLVSVIANSSRAAAAYVREGYSNIRIGMFLEIATTLGALAGANVAIRLPLSAIAVVFGLVLICSAYLSGRPDFERISGDPPDRLATLLRMHGSYSTPTGQKVYHAHAIPTGFSLMFVAGMLSGLLGIGSGAVKVLAMDRAMRLPFKVSTTTSNFMIGVTAAASAGVYLSRGYIDPGLAMPVMLGVVVGSLFGTHLLMRAPTRTLRIVFSLVIATLGAEMIYNGLTGRF
jgi:uncharacterized membrane protein YfcA